MTERLGRARLAIAYDIAATSPMGLAGLLSEVCDIVWVVDLDDPALGAMGRLLHRLGTVIDTSGASLTETIGLVTDAAVDGVIAFNDRQIYRAAVVANALGLPGNPPAVVEALVDKHVQRAVMASAGIDVPNFQLIPGDAEVATAVSRAEELTYPVVLKPLRGDSSRDVVAVSSPDELAVALRRATDAGGARTGFVVEEYLPDGHTATRGGLGGYVSVETIVRNDDPVPVAVTGKFPLVEPFREAGNFMPHPLPQAEVADVLDLAHHTALALGVRSGALHIEIKLTPAGPRVIEVNGRIGGGAIDSIYLKRTGQSLTELAVRVALGQPVDLVAETPAEWNGPFTYEFFAQPPMAAARFGGVAVGDCIVGTAGAETVAVNREVGDALDWRAGSQGYVLRVGGVATDRGTLASVPDAVVEAARIEYDFH